jgi:precorrin-6B methylase 2
VLNEIIRHSVNFIRLSVALINPASDYVGWGKRDKSSARKYFNSRQQQSNFFLWNQLSIEDGKKICEIGSNAGSRIFDLAAQHPLLEFCGIDMNSDAISFANHQARKMDLKNLEFVTLDIRNSQFREFLREHEFACIFSWATLIYVHPWNIKRVLEAMLQNADEFVIVEQIELKKRFSIVYYMGHLKWKHNYSQLIVDISEKQKMQVSIEVQEVPKDVWDPGGGDAKLLKVVKRNL